jgi:hypothetical protein
MADIFSYQADRKADKAMEQVIKEGKRVFEELREPSHPVSRELAPSRSFPRFGWCPWKPAGVQFSRQPGKNL